MTIEAGGADAANIAFPIVTMQLIALHLLNILPQGEIGSTLNSQWALELTLQCAQGCRASGLRTRLLDSRLGCHDA